MPDPGILIRQLQAKDAYLQEQVDAILAGGSYTDEQARDAVQAMLTDSSTIDFSFDDAGNTITATVIAGTIGPGYLDFDPATQAELDAVAGAKLNSSVLDTDGTLAANSDAKVATQKAGKTYADTKAADSAVVHNTGTETVDGAKTFSSNLRASAGGSASSLTLQVGPANCGAYSSGASRLDLAAGGQQMLNMQAGNASTFKNYPLRADKGYYPTIKKITAANFFNSGGGVYTYYIVDGDPDVIVITELPPAATKVQFVPANSVDVKQVAIEDWTTEYFAAAGCGTIPAEICDASFIPLHTINTDGGTAKLRINLGDYTFKVVETKA